MSQTINNLPAMQDPGFDTWVGKIPWRRDLVYKILYLEYKPLVFLPGESP